MSLYYIESLFMWLVIYSFAGWVYESIVCSITQKKPVNRGFLNGPYCPIYGFGAVFDILVLGRLTNPFLLFFLGMLLSCALEYATSWAMEKLFHARWWDYSDSKFNINGRICLLGAVVFGAFAVVLVLFIHPFVSHVTAMITEGAMHVLCIVLLVVIVTDVCFTVAGVIGLNEKMRRVTDAVVKKFRSFDVAGTFQGVIDAISATITRQERRMLSAFPKLRSINYEDALELLRGIVTRKK